MAWSRSACCPVRPNRACSAAPRLDRSRPAGVVGRGGVGRLGESGDGLVQVRLLPGAPNRACSAFPRLDSIAGRSAWSAGVASAASENRVMAWSRSACCPVRPNRACSAAPRLDRYPGRSG